MSANLTDITARLLHAMTIDSTAVPDIPSVFTPPGASHADVADWLKRQFRPVPVDFGQKACLAKGWSSLWVNEEDIPKFFKTRTNIGVLTGAGAGDLVDVDLDSKETLGLADVILVAALANTLVFGRKSKRRSHYFYRAKGAKTERFIDPVIAGKPGAMLVELRSDGCQTVVPPSVHESAEPVEFELHYIEPAAVDAAELRKYVCLIAAGALIIRYWPKQGSRHHASLALCGVLLRLGWPEDEVEAFVTLLAQQAGDEEAEGRGRNARSSASRIAASQPATGWPTLGKYFDQRVLDAIQLWLAPWAGTAQPTPSAQAATLVMPTARMPTADPKVFRGVAGDIVRTIEPHSEAAPLAILVQFMVGFGSIIGRDAYFRVEADTHHCNEFVVLVGLSSKGRKGTSYGWVIKLLSSVDPSWAAERVASGLSSGEGLMVEVRDEVKAFDKDKKMEVVVDPGVDDKRLLVVETEYAGVLKVIRREGNTLSVVVRNAWDRGDLRSMTKNNRLKATSAHISVIGHITGSELTRNLTETESANGFGNRHIFFLVERSKYLPDGGALDDHALDPFVTQVREAVDFSRTAGLVRRDAGANARWHAVYPKLSEGEDTLVGRLTGRAEAHVMRLALLYALLDKSSVITLDHLDAALALWNYSVASCRAIFGDQLGDPLADAILAALRRNPDGMSRTEISRVALGGHAKSGAIATALALLQDRALATVEQTETGGRPGELWRATAAMTVSAEVAP